MATYEVKTVRAGTTVECPACPGFYRVPDAIVAPLLPIKLICPHCGHVWVWKDALPIIPKTTVQPREFGRLITRETAAKEQLAIQAALLHEGKQVYSSETYPYLAKLLEQKMAETLRTIKEIRKAFAKLGEQYIKDCSEELQAKYGLEDFNGAEAELFFRHPYCGMTYPCDNDQQGNFARFVLAPKFYNMPYSYTVTPDAPELPCGSFQVGITNVYLGLTGGMPTLTEKLLHWPERLSLRVADNKVVGVDLGWVWQDIPGVTPDADHTETTPSLLITKPAETLPWLMQHGVNPYGTATLFDERYAPDRLLKESVATGGTEFGRIWVAFLKTGRLGLFCRNTKLAREQGGRVLQAFRGGKIVIMDSQEQATEWRVGMAPHAAQEDAARYNPLFIVPDKLADVLDSTLDAVDCIGLDVACISQELLAFLPRLYGRRCCIVAVGDSPLFDFDQEDKVAPLVWGLLGTFMQLEAKKAPPKGVRYNVTSQFRQLLSLMASNKRPPKRMDKP